jgi:hypothetical protein
MGGRAGVPADRLASQIVETDLAADKLGSLTAVWLAPEVDRRRCALGRRWWPADQDSGPRVNAPSFPRRRGATSTPGVRIRRSCRFLCSVHRPLPRAGTRAQVSPRVRRIASVGQRQGLDVVRSPRDLRGELPLHRTVPPCDAGSIVVGPSYDEHRRSRWRSTTVRLTDQLPATAGNTTVWTTLASRALGADRVVMRYVVPARWLPSTPRSVRPELAEWRIPLRFSIMPVNPA